MIRRFVEMMNELDKMEKFLESLVEETTVADAVVKKGEAPNEKIISLDVPGVDKDGIKIYSKGNTLYVEAKRSDREKDNIRKFRYTSDADTIKVKNAKLKNGVLTLTIEEGQLQEFIDIEIE